MALFEVVGSMERRIERASLITFGSSGGPIGCGPAEEFGDALGKGARSAALTHVCDK